MLRERVPKSYFLNYSSMKKHSNILAPLNSKESQSIIGSHFFN